jgi:hypothetical protein
MYTVHNLSYRFTGSGIPIDIITTEAVMSTSCWDTNEHHINVTIDCTAHDITVNLTHGQQHATPIWQIQSSVTDCGTLLQRINNSLAQVQQIDTIVHTIQTDCTALSWQFGIQLCTLLPLPLMIPNSLSYVACISEQHVNSHEIETYFRKQSLIWAHKRVRINAIRQQNATPIPLSTMQFLMGGSSRVLTGALFLADGQMLMGGHPTAERIMAHQFVIHQGE